MDIEYIVSSAEALDLPPDSFDVVIACQCFLYFDKNVVLPKIHRLLKENGHFCVIWVAWLPEEDKIANASEKLVLKYNPSWTGAGFTRESGKEPDWAAPLFRPQNAITYDIAIPFTRESWHGRIKASRGVGASALSKDTIAQFENDHLKMLSQYPENFTILHHVILTYLNKQKQEPPS